MTLAESILQASGTLSKRGMHLRDRIGLKHHNATLTFDQVKAIRAAAKAGNGYGAIERLFGVSRWTVRDIVTFRTRKSA